MIEENITIIDELIKEYDSNPFDFDNQKIIVTIDDMNYTISQHYELSIFARHILKKKNLMIRILKCLIIMNYA